MTPTISLEGKVAVVTGGSRGIGAAIVNLFWKAGASVVFSYRKDRAAAARVVAECDAKNVVAVKADVSRMKDAESLVGEAIERFERLDILVANAGIDRKSTRLN